jgi:hypothetical protein
MEENIKTDVKFQDSEVVEWIHVTQDKGQWRTLANTVANLGKGKARPRTGLEGPEGEGYSSTLSLTSALYGGGWSTPRPGRFTPGKETQYPLYRRLVGPRAGLDGCGKSRRPLGSDPRTVQAVGSRYTGYAIPAHNELWIP